MNYFRNFSKETKEPLINLKLEDMIPLSPYIEEKDGFKEISDDWKNKYNFSLDGFSAFPFPEPTEEEKKKNCGKIFKRN